VSKNNNLVPVSSNNKEAYEKDLDMLLTQAYNEYKHITLDRPQVQQRYIHSYLWVTVALIGAQTYLCKYAIDKFYVCISDTIWPALLFLCICMSFFYSGIAFLVGIRSLRGNIDLNWPLYGLMRLAEYAYTNRGTGYKLRTILLNRYAEAIRIHKDAVDIRAIKLRFLCDSLTYSIFFSILAGLFYFAY